MGRYKVMPTPCRHRGGAKVIFATSWWNIWPKLANTGKLCYNSLNIYSETNEQKESENQMSKKLTTEQKAANKAEREAKKTAKPANEKSTELKPSQILRALGKAGVTVKHGQAIAVEQKWDIAPQLVSNYIRDGKGGVGKIAELTKVRIEELKSSAKEPVKAEKEAK